MKRLLCESLLRFLLICLATFSELQSEKVCLEFDGKRANVHFRRKQGGDREHQNFIGN